MSSNELLKDIVCIKPKTESNSAMEEWTLRTPISIFFSFSCDIVIFYQEVSSSEAFGLISHIHACCCCLIAGLFSLVSIALERLSKQTMQQYCQLRSQLPNVASQRYIWPLLMVISKKYLQTNFLKSSCVWPLAMATMKNFQ